MNRYKIDPLKQRLNTAVHALAAKDRQRAVAILAQFNVLTTAELRPEQWQTVLDSFEAALAQLDTKGAP
ncbi:MAG TPA: hypothetical protein VGI93_01540 [Steroidobacteraceae bacterium]|jgi:hypothetical protein